MLPLETIQQQFLLFTGLDETQTAPWLPLIISGKGRLEALLNPDISVEEHTQRLCTTAAALAYADYLMMTSSALLTAEQIKVGDVSIKSSTSTGTHQGSQEIQRYFLESVKDLLQPVVGIFPIYKEDADESCH